DGEIKCHEVESKLKLERAVNFARVKTPTFDEKMSWANYHKQFETAARAKEWSEQEKAVNLNIALRADALDVLQTIPVEEMDDFEQLKKRLNMRYGHDHLEHLYQSQLKNRNRNETRLFKNIK
ncbi:unnamed protein product, partial [Psylliodes chrysocephalus]